MTETRSRRSLATYSREELVGRIDYLERALADTETELAVFEQAFADMRACEDRRCGLCAHCITILFVRTVGARPQVIPEKYRAPVPWRK